MRIDNQKGLGTVHCNRQVDRLGFRVQMKPSTFLSLTSNLDYSEKSVIYIENHIKSGGSIGSSFLSINVPFDWLTGNLSEPARVGCHEGRNRMQVIKNLYRNRPVEAHIFFCNGIKCKDLTVEMINKMRSELISRDNTLITGPLFEFDFDKYYYKH